MLPVRGGGSGVCRFCGAGVCQKHTRAQRYVTKVTFPADHFFGGTMTKSHDFVVVDNALWCGRCSLQTYYHK